MNKIKSVLFVAGILLALVFTFGCSSDDGGDNSGGGSDGPCPNVVTSNGTVRCGGQTYKTVEIGNQVWMAENLNYNAKGSVCYEKKESNCKKYGRLYDWATAQGGICPSGWHIPSDDDWNVLMKTVNPSCSDNSGETCDTGTKLKAREGWDSYTGDKHGPVPPSTNEFGFSALPGGRYNYDGDVFSAVGLAGQWWSSTESEYDSDNARYLYIRYDYEFAVLGFKNKYDQYSVRCVKDD